MLKYTTSLILFFWINLSSFAQDDKSVVENDSLIFKEKYGLRIGADLSKLAKTSFSKDYSGFEVVADYRLTKRFYIAGELGFEKQSTETNFLNSSSKGSYFKAGVDYNLYNNWLGMENLIVGGLRLGVSSFSQTLNSYTIYDTNSQTWGQIESNINNEFSGLSAAWLELVFGVKAEIFNNLFLGFNVQLKGRLSEKEPENFENLFIPGFGRTFDNSKVGTGISYTISYLLPIYKKTSKVKKEDNLDE